MTGEVSIKEGRSFEVHVSGLPKGQPRPRAFVRAGRAAVYDCGTAEGWKSSVATAFAGYEGICLTTPLRVELTFIMPRPKGHYKTNGELKNGIARRMFTQKPDADNLAKAVLDALTAIRVWKDDDQVCELNILKRWEDTRFRFVGCYIRIAELQEVIR